MAIPNCTLCNGEQGLMLTTTLNDGDTIVIGGQCLASYVLAMAGSVTAGMSPEDCIEYGELFDAIAANDKRPKKNSAPTAASGAKRTKSAQSADAATTAHSDKGTSGEQSSSGAGDQAETEPDAASGPPGATPGKPGDNA